MDFKANRRNRMKRVVEMETSTENVHRMTNVHGPELDQLTNFKNGDIRDGRVLPQKRHDNGLRRKQLDRVRLENLVKCARVMVGVAVSDDHFFDHHRRDSLHSKGLGTVGGRVHHDAPLVDPNDETRGRAVGVEPVRVPQGRDSE